MANTPIKAAANIATTNKSNINTDAPINLNDPLNWRFLAYSKTPSNSAIQSRVSLF